MRIVLMSIDAKYIHNNLAIRLLKANTSYPVELVEFTIKDSIDSMIHTLSGIQPDIIGISVYLWNRKLTLELVQKLKQQGNPILILGGPEVSYDVELLLSLYPIDFIISGEGEIAFHQLLDAIHQNTSFEHIHNLSYRSNESIQSNKCVSIPSLDLLKSGYFITPINPNKIQYIETSRGCPYRCSYCLASLEKPVRYWNEVQIQHDLLALIQSGAKTFKFLDRTFNSNIERSKRIFQFIIDHHQFGQSFQFEITGDIFPLSLLSFLHEKSPKNLFRFEIGIQSTNERTNHLVLRKQNNDALFQFIDEIMHAQIIDLHLDIIAGLPMEDKTSFQKTFNRVFHVGAKELQLGFLKLLKGTKIRKDAEKFHYHFQDEPPYEIIHNTCLSHEDLLEIKAVEEMVEIFWNKQFFPTTFQNIMPIENPYTFFLQLHHHLPHPIPKSLPTLTQLFESFLQGIYPNHPIDVWVKRDYLAHHPIKPKIWWQQAASLHEKKMLLQHFLSNHPELSSYDVFKHSVLIPSQSITIVAIYHHDGIQFYSS